MHSRINIIQMLKGIAARLFFNIIWQNNTRTDR